uniref:AlNc14C43G3602 protein n=1 Tax=Albugo laibachii Nc14 TaxID=890382 RepID=F0WA58_9STRA|nr:AlNc14C43G3602 [Albugo laibachii Nc14]|eukprot:CCA18028.1 AlNc14C43G3602 [Albugo laibachii Nc14]
MKMLSLKIWRRKRRKRRKQYVRLADMAFELQRQALNEYHKYVKSKMHGERPYDFSQRLMKGYVETLKANEGLLKMRLEKEYQMTLYEPGSPEFDMTDETGVLRYIISPASLEVVNEAKAKASQYSQFQHVHMALALPNID